jgi:hypothetical protein
MVARNEPIRKIRDHIGPYRSLAWICFLSVYCKSLEEKGKKALAAVWKIDCTERNG